MHVKSANHTFEFYLQKDGTRTIIQGPFWYDFVRSHDVRVGDVVTFALHKDEDWDDESYDEEDDEICDYEEEDPEYFFDLTVADPDGTEKPLLRGIPGIFFPQCTTSEVPQCNTLVLPFN
jgi:hypothetical protein